MTQVSTQNSSKNIAFAHQSLRNFYLAEYKSFSQIAGTFQSVQDQFKDKFDECQSYIGQIQGKKRQNQKYGKLSQGVLQAKQQEIKSKVKNIDFVSVGIKQIVAKVNPQKLAKLPVKDERTLSNLFKVLYETLYSQNQQFNWDSFKKLALKHEGGEDFIFRLVNINFKDLSQNRYQKLLQLKSDPQFQKMATKSNYSKDIIDIADWVDYVCLGHQFVIEKDRTQKQYQKIRKDVDKKSKGSLQVSEKFWRQTSSQIDQYQTQMRNIFSQLKTIQLQMKKASQKQSLVSKQNKPTANYQKANKKIQNQLTN